jgi:ABC-type nitrate/sulfonate/bicarbonate transport system ATPase subunit
MSPIIELRDVGITFPPTRNGQAVVALDGLSLLIQKDSPYGSDHGHFVVLLGPSGCGKSTILSLIAGLIPPDKGEVVVFNETVTGPHRFSATVQQGYTCFPWLTVLQNVEFGLRLEGRSDGETKQLASEYLHKVELDDRAHAYPKELSGGMQQRVAIARTLAMKRPIVLMDEPFGALDAQTRADMQQMLLQLWEAERNTIVFVTHDIVEALLLADRILVFSPRPARIIRDMMVPFPFERPPELVHTQEFVNCAEDLRQLLRKPHAELPRVAPRTG